MTEREESGGERERQKDKEEKILRSCGGYNDSFSEAEFLCGYKGQLK